MPRFRAEYRYSRPFSSARHDWFVIGRKGAIHLHINDSGPEYGYSAGLECHYRSPPDYMENDAPSHDECWVLKCPCWHDGTSLYAQEFFLPIWQISPNDHEAMFRLLEREYEKRFSPRCEDAVSSP